MRTALKRIRGAIGMGVTWALVWAPVAVFVGTQIIDPDDSMDEMWVMVGALPGFFAGVIFSIILGIAARRQRLDNLTMPRVAGWGAAAGIAIGILPFILGDADGSPPAWLLAAIIIPTFAVLSTLSAAGSLAIARRAINRESLSATDALSELALTDEEKYALLGEGHSGSEFDVSTRPKSNATPLRSGRQ